MAVDGVFLRNRFGLETRGLDSICASSCAQFLHVHWICFLNNNKKRIRTRAREAPEQSVLPVVYSSSISMAMDVSLGGWSASACALPNRSTLKKYQHASRGKKSRRTASVVPNPKPATAFSDLLATMTLLPPGRRRRAAADSSFLHAPSLTSLSSSSITTSSFPSFWFGPLLSCLTTPSSISIPFFFVPPLRFSSPDSSAPKKMIWEKCWRTLTHMG
jgi:hypothetical protein